MRLRPLLLLALATRAAPAGRLTHGGLALLHELEADVGELEREMDVDEEDNEDVNEDVNEVANVVPATNDVANVVPATLDTSSTGASSIGDQDQDDQAEELTSTDLTDSTSDNEVDWDSLLVVEDDPEKEVAQVVSAHAENEKLVKGSAQEVSTEDLWSATALKVAARGRSCTQQCQDLVNRLRTVADKNNGVNDAAGFLYQFAAEEKRRRDGEYDQNSAKAEELKKQKLREAEARYRRLHYAEFKHKEKVAESNLRNYLGQLKQNLDSAPKVSYSSLGLREWEESGVMAICVPILCYTVDPAPVATKKEGICWAETTSILKNVGKTYAFSYWGQSGVGDFVQKLIWMTCMAKAITNVDSVKSLNTFNLLQGEDNEEIFPRLQTGVFQTIPPDKKATIKEMFKACKRIAGGYVERLTACMAAAHLAS